MESDYRSRDSATMLTILEGLFPKVGITRVADVTDLDWVGLPVATAFRPRSETLAVSQGKSEDRVSAKVGAVMESLELWHAEQVPDRGDFEARADDLSLPFDLSDLNLAPGSFATGRMLLPWTWARSMQSDWHGSVPTDLVGISFDLDRTLLRAGIPLFSRSSNGLAGGATQSEAEYHALLEVIERDILTRATAAQTELIDRQAIEFDVSPGVGRVLNDASVYLEIENLHSRWPIPCFRVRMWSEDFPLVAVGTGAHPRMHRALERAVLEAAQSRITQISGVRDDIDERRFLQGSMLSATRPRVATKVLTDDCTDESLVEAVGADGAVARLVTVCCSITGHEPLVVPLSNPAWPISVVRVIIPTAKFDLSHSFSGVNSQPAAALR
jgi:ribosomal protein S12 methylthiotransferase accessory factor